MIKSSKYVIYRSTPDLLQSDVGFRFRESVPPYPIRKHKLQLMQPLSESLIKKAPSWKDRIVSNMKYFSTFVCT